MRNVAVLCSSIVAIAVACGGSDDRSAFDGRSSSGADGGSSGSTDFGGQQFRPDGTPCSGLDCKIVNCPDTKTSLTGKVYDPAGANPLYNVMVYIPGGTEPEKLPPLKDASKEPGGIACETCASVVVNPVRSALTDGTGTFRLDDVPVDKNLPIVVQVGKWRRLLHVDTSKSCTENTAPDKALRLPRNGQEGDLPQIAVASGKVDALECFLRGIGVDDREFVSGHGGSGHVHMFKGEGGGMGASTEELWFDTPQLKKYDLVLLSCEGQELMTNKYLPERWSGFPYLSDKLPEKVAKMHEYLNAGGKVFATHYHYVWFNKSPDPAFKALGDFAVGNGNTATASFDINQSFPKGAKYAEWLKAIGASSTLGKLDLGGVTNSVTRISSPPMTTWIKDANGKAKYLTFNTPLNQPADKQCGRAVFSDVHSAADEGETGAKSPSAITQCPITAGNLNNKQKAIEFLFFDLSACVTDESVAPLPPK